MAFCRICRSCMLSDARVNYWPAVQCLLIYLGPSKIRSTPSRADSRPVMKYVCRYAEYLLPTGCPVGLRSNLAVSYFKNINWLYIICCLYSTGTLLTKPCQHDEYCRSEKYATGKVTQKVCWHRKYNPMYFCRRGGNFVALQWEMFQLIISYSHA